MTALTTITASKITGYLQCPRKYAFRYAWKVPSPWRASGLAFGSAVHSGLRVFHEARKIGAELDPEAVIHAFRVDLYAEFSGDIRFKDGETPEGLASLGEALIAAYLDAYKEIEVASCEEAFEIPLVDPATGEVVGPNLKGVFDLILAGDVLAEIKTAARAYDEGTLARHVQLSAYAYAYRRLHGRDPQLRVIALLKQKRPRVETLPAERTIDDDAWFAGLAAEVARAIDAGLFPPNPGWACSDCEYQEPCRTMRPGSELVAIGRRPRETNLPTAALP